MFTTLRRVTPDIFYYKTKAGREVDFIAGRQDRSRMLIQVCESTADPQTRNMTAQAEALYDFVRLTIEHELVEELDFLANYDKTKQAVQKTESN